MRGKTHVMTTGAAVADLVMVSPRLDMALIGAGMMATCLVPDLDSKQSILSKKLKKMKIVKYVRHRGIMHSIWGWLMFTGMMSIINYALALIIPGSIVKHGVMSLFLGFSLGYLAHLVEDSFSRAGIVWLYPIGEIDHYTWQRFHAINRPVNHYKKLSNGRYVPYRHAWGRGYQTGSKNEYVPLGLLMIIGLFLVIWRVSPLV